MASLHQKTSLAAGEYTTINRYSSGCPKTTIAVGMVARRYAKVAKNEEFVATDTEVRRSILNNSGG